MSALPTHYDHDFNQWLQQQIHLLKTHRLAELDIASLIIELEAIDKSQQRELASRCLVLLAHLLKWHFQPNHRSSSWRGSLTEQRLRLARLLRDNPSLKSQLETTLAEVYLDAVKIAAQETGLASSEFPAQCPYGVESVLDENFWLSL